MTVQELKTQFETLQAEHVQALEDIKDLKHNLEALSAFVTASQQS